MATGPGVYRDSGGRQVVSAAMLRVLQASVIFIYFGAGLAKALNGDWLKHSDTLWSQVQGFHRNELAAWMLRTLPKWAWTGMQHSALAFECLAPLLFCVRRWRACVIFYGVMLHVMIAALMSGLIYFSAQMWTFYALFITANEWRALGEGLRGRALVWLGGARA